MVRVEPYAKLNGQIRWHVYYGSLLLGQFYTPSNARRFIEREVRPAIQRGVLS